MKQEILSSAKTRARLASAPCRPLKVTETTIERLIEIFKLLGDKSRLKIVLALAQDRELHVSALCGLLEQSQPAVSHHLLLMRRVGLVAFRRDGKHNYYSLAPGYISDLLEQYFSDTRNSQKQFQLEDFVLAFRPR